MRSPILYFFLQVLGIPLDLGPDISHKQGGFSETLLKEGLQFVPSREDGIVAFNLCFVLLPAEINPILEEWGREGDAFVARGSGRVKMVLTLSTEVIALHMQAPIVKVRISGFEGAIVGCSTCLELTMLLAFNKQFYGQLGDSLQVLVRVSLRQAWNGGGSGSRDLSRNRGLSRRGSGSTKDGECTISLDGGFSKLIFAAKRRIAAGT